MFREYEHDEPTREMPGSEREYELSRGASEASDGVPGEIVFDCTGLDEMRVSDLSWILTARNLARAEDQTVWAAGLPGPQWQTLHAMGLAHLFQPFPVQDEMRS